MIDAKTNEECPHAGQWIGISDGSSVYAWRCPDCGLERPKNAFTRGKWRVDSANERTTATASLARERLERALEPFAFKSAPNSFAGTDGSVTECLVCDEDVRRARSELEGR